MRFDRVTDDSVPVLVRAFYDKVRVDAQLAPVFAKALGHDWSGHMATMCDFWSTAMRLSRRYKGDMLATHQRVEGLHSALFERWLELFEQTVGEHFAAQAGIALDDRARKTARNLQLALFHRPYEAPCVSDAAPALQRPRR
jgi:hemoglobin